MKNNQANKFFRDLREDVWDEHSPVHYFTVHGLLYRLNRFIAEC